METYYLRKRWAEQAFWDYARDPDRRDVPMSLKTLADRDQELVGPHEVRRVLAYLHNCGFRDDEAPNLKTPVVIVDMDDRPVVAVSDGSLATAVEPVTGAQRQK